MKSSGIFVLLAFQVICAGVFLYEILSALTGAAPISWYAHEVIEILAALGLIIGATITARLAWRARARAAKADQTLRMASGAFHAVVQDRFRDWNLTPAEQDVALFVIKGLSTQDIAALRNTSEGTVKTQTNSIYRKADVSSRAQLVSSFIQDLAATPLLDGD